MPGLRHRCDDSGIRRILLMTNNEFGDLPMKKLILAGVCSLLGATAYAQEVEENVEINVVVADDGGEVMNWTSSASDLGLADLAVGESRMIQANNGEPITISRTEEGLTVDVNGEVMVLPDIGMHGEHATFIAGPVAHEAVNIDVIAGSAGDMTTPVGTRAYAMRAGKPDGVTIISSVPLDASVQESIRSVLISAGHDEEVRFIDGSGERETVRVIRKHVEVVAEE